MSSSKVKFPEGFYFGVASSAYQVEGAWNIDGKGECQLDRLFHTKPELVQDGTNGDNACESYRLYKKDVELIKEIGFDFYRFSINWARILPTGEVHNVNEPGVKYYDNLINELLGNGIKPMITMYHWDLPQHLQELGGWLNPLIVDYFEDYARLLYRLYGDRVKWWITINEPEVAASFLTSPSMGYDQNMGSVGKYLMGHHFLLAHAKAYRAYDDEFRSSQGGQVSIGLNTVSYFSKTDSKDDKDAAERHMEFEMAWFADPIYKGDYPPVMRQYIDRASEKEGRKKSKLPKLTAEEINLVKGTSDFFAYHHYTSMLAAYDPESTSNPDSLITTSSCPTWKRSSVQWLNVVPEGLRMCLKWIKDRYDDPTIFITECGYGDTEEIDSVEDHNRIYYFQNYLSSLLDAIYKDKCRVIGFTAWSILDNFEWTDGLRYKFGLVHVDNDDPDKKRTLKKSAHFFKNIVARRSL